MTRGIGYQTQSDALAQLVNMAESAEPIDISEFNQRIENAQTLMKAQDIDAIYLNAGTNLEYFTGLRWYPSERLVGAILPVEGAPKLIAPAFELGSLEQAMQVPLEPLLWEEHESPIELMAQTLRDAFGDDVRIGLDESTAYSFVARLEQCILAQQLCDAKSVIAECRMRKSGAELALIQTAMDMTIAVHRATASMLKEGISASEVRQFIDEAHRRVGAAGSFFCIVLFGKATSYPHGVQHEQYLQANDWVLIDTGCKLHGYHSDITRTYAFGEATPEQQRFWQYERQLQQVAFDAAKLGQPCHTVDDAVRHELARLSLEPDYKLPGVPHRTGHGIGMDLHEWPYLVGGDDTPLARGMCFSNEPMVILPEQFGVRLEDHFYMTDDGPKWFTEPSRSLDDPLNLGQ